MRPLVHISIPLALLQMMAVVLGVMLTKTAFTVYNYPNPDIRWNAFSLLVRNHGYLLVVIPLVWTGMVLWQENRKTLRWNRVWTMASGLVLLGLLAWIFWYAASHVYVGRLRLAGY